MHFHCAFCTITRLSTEDTNLVFLRSFLHYEGIYVVFYVLFLAGPEAPLREAARVCPKQAGRTISWQGGDNPGDFFGFEHFLFQVQPGGALPAHLLGNM